VMNRVKNATTLPVKKMLQKLMGFFPSGARWHEPRLCSFDTIELDAAEMKMAIQIQAEPGIMGFLEVCFDMRFSRDRD